jgi:DNA-binding transcriptional MerR regulator
MDALTIHEAAQITDWSARMLRYIERAGLIEPQRSSAGYRLYGPAELQRLRTLRELVTRFDIGLGEVGFAQRLRRDEELSSSLDAWFEAQPRRPEHVPAADWLRWEQDKHTKLLALAGAHAAPQPAAAH